MFKWIVYFAICCSPLLWGEQTLSIVKPDAVKAGHVGEIVSRFEKEGFQIKAIKMLTLTQEQAERFYQNLSTKPFFGEVTQYMSSGPVVAIVLEAPDAVKKNRAVMGATNPQEALPGTIRKTYGKNVMENAVHGSDSAESAQKEIEFFFK